MIKEEEIGVIIDNLLSNSLKATSFLPPHRREIRVRVGVDHAASEFWIEVEDNGIGIKRDDLRNVLISGRSGFKTMGIGGTGMGLSYVGDIAKSHGGRVEVTSRYRQQTTVRVIFPVPLE